MKPIYYYQKFGSKGPAHLLRAGPFATAAFTKVSSLSNFEIDADQDIDNDINNPLKYADLLIAFGNVINTIGYEVHIWADTVELNNGSINVSGQNGTDGVSVDSTVDATGGTGGNGSGGAGGGAADITASNPYGGAGADRNTFQGSPGSANSGATGGQGGYSSGNYPGLSYAFPIGGDGGPSGTPGGSATYGAGGGGSGGNVNGGGAGGGGGAGAGLINIVCRVLTITGSFAFNAYGGNGGNAGASGSADQGSGGGGGSIFIAAQKKIGGVNLLGISNLLGGSGHNNGNAGNFSLNKILHNGISIVSTGGDYITDWDNT